MGEKTVWFPLARKPEAGRYALGSSHSSKGHQYRQCGPNADALEKGFERSVIRRRST